MAHNLPFNKAMTAWANRIFPVRSLAILLFIGTIDLISTAWLHAHGLIVELNPLMRPLIEHSEWTFALAKGFTLVAAYVVMVRYARNNRAFVARSCTYASIAYLGVWAIWFTSAR